MNIESLEFDLFHSVQPLQTPSLCYSGYEIVCDGSIRKNETTMWEVSSFSPYLWLSFVIYNGKGMKTPFRDFCNTDTRPVIKVTHFVEYLEYFMMHQHCVLFP